MNSHQVIKMGLYVGLIEKWALLYDSSFRCVAKNDHTDFDFVFWENNKAGSTIVASKRIPILENNSKYRRIHKPGETTVISCKLI